jgi:hypothetical protein
MHTANKTIGVYCLANDVVIEWFEMFLRSYQLQNAALPLTVIPYDGNISRVRALQSQFRFDLMDEAQCAKFDELALRTMGSLHAAGMYRKLACFFGAYDEFIFLDSDIAVTTPLQWSFDAFAKSDYDFVYFDFDIDAAYKPAFAAKMIAEYHSHGFNAGAFMSRKGVFRETELWPLADAAAKVRDGLITGTIDQPYFNYIMDVTGRRQAHIDTLLPKLARKAFARQPFHFDPLTRRATTPDGKLLTFIHWCGCVHPTMFRPEIFLHYRTLGLIAAERRRYLRTFYYLRFRRKLKQRLLKYKLSSKLVEWREKRKKS